MKLTVLVLAVTLATLASFGTASPMLITKQVVKKLIAKHQSPATSAIVYTPVVPRHEVLSVPVRVASVHEKLLPGLGSLVKQHPLLQRPLHSLLLPNRTPGGVEEVYHKETVVPAGPYPPVTEVHELPPCAPEQGNSGAPAPPVAPVSPEELLPEPLDPAPEYGVPAPVYGLPAASSLRESEYSSASSSSSSGSGPEGEAKYVAVNLGARHEAPLPGHTQSVLLENLQEAPGAEGLRLLPGLVPPLVSNELANSWYPVVLGADQLRSASQPETPAVADEPDSEARYIAINGDLRHEAPLPGYDRSIVIENLDVV